MLSLLIVFQSLLKQISCSTAKATIVYLILPTNGVYGVSRQSYRYKKKKIKTPSSSLPSQISINMVDEWVSCNSCLLTHNASRQLFMRSRWKTSHWTFFITNWSFCLAVTVTPTLSRGHCYCLYHLNVSLLCSLVRFWHFLKR